MRRNAFRSLLVASLLGGLVIHGALVACSGSGSAGAQTSTCQRWAVTDFGSSFLPQTGPAVPTVSGTTVPTAVVPDGWEPIGGVGSNYMLRKCIQ